MAVVAKMNVTGVRPFGDTSLVKLNCVYDSQGVNSDAYEDRRFTTATPWGEGDLAGPVGDRFRAAQQLTHPPEQSVYLVFTELEEVMHHPVKKALVKLRVTCSAFIEWGGCTKQIEFTRADKSAQREFSLNLRLAIDNKAASEQFVEGRDYLLVIYDAADVPLNEAVTLP